LASPDVPECATRKVIEDTGCGHRMIITTINFRIKPRTLNGKPLNARYFKRAKWQRYK
jgi:hypothetical protein